MLKKSVAVALSANPRPIRPPYGPPVRTAVTGGEGQTFSRAGEVPINPIRAFKNKDNLERGATQWEKCLAVRESLAELMRDKRMERKCLIVVSYDE